MTEIRSDNIRRRYASERRFRFYGAAALAVTAAFLLFLLIDIVGKGLPAFFESNAIVEVTVDPQKLDPANLRSGDYDAMVKDTFRTIFPDAEGRVARKQLNGLLSQGAADELRDRVLANPALVGQKVKVPVLLTDDADLYLKGMQTETSVAKGQGTLQLSKLGGDTGYLLTGDAKDLKAGQVIQSQDGLLRIAKIDNGSLIAEAIVEPKTLNTLLPGEWSLYTFSVPEAERRISDRQAVWLETLKAQGAVRQNFSWRFFESGDSREPELAGIRGALVGSLLTVAVALVLALPLGIAAAIYLEQFAPKNKFTDLIEVNINNLAAVPSIIFGLLGLAMFLNFFGMPRSAPVVGGLVLALLVLPTIIIASRAALKAVPPSIIEAALGVGASHQQAVFQHVLPLALPGILTGTILGLARAFGETAPLLMIGMVAFIVDVPGSLTDAATVLPVQIFLWSDLPEIAFRSKTAAAIIVLLVVLFSLNAVAIYMRKRFERRW
jgi:phosphate transport system permease protein